MLKTLQLLAITSLMFLTACTDMQDALFDVGLEAERAMSGLELRRITRAGHDWSYLDSAPGNHQKPVLLMLHGFAVDKDNWLRFARRFDDYRVIAPDLPGHGESSFNPQFTYDFVQQTIWLDEFIRALKLTNVHIMGNSMGGAIALMYSYAQPENVRSITLMNAAGVYPPEASDMQKIIDNGGKNPLIVNSLEDFDALRHFAMAKQPFLPWPASQVLARRAKLRNPVNIKIFADIHAVAEAAKYRDDNLKMLQHIKQPVLILWGKKDRVLDVSSVKVFNQYLPNSQSIIFPDLGHAPMLESPDESAEAVLKFVQSIEQKNPATTTQLTHLRQSRVVAETLAPLALGRQN